MKNDEGGHSVKPPENYLDVLKTSDFTLASTLYSLGFNIAGIDKTNPKRVVFYFKKTSDLETTVDKYFNNQVKINPLDFDRAQREIRAQIHTDR